MWVTVFELERWFTTQIEAYANTKILSIFVFWIFVSNCFYRWLKKNRMSEIPIFLQPSGPCYKKSRMKFKKQKSRSCLYFYKLQFEWWINSLAQKLWPTTLFEVGKNDQNQNVRENAIKVFNNYPSHCGPTMMKYCFYLHFYIFIIIFWT